MSRSVRNARRVKSLSDRMRGAWGMVVIASLTHSAVTVYPYARDVYDAARGMTITGALPHVDEDSNIAPYIESYSDELGGEVFSSKNPVPLPPHPPKDKGMGYTDKQRGQLQDLTEEN